MFRPLLLGYHQVTSMSFKEAVQCKSKNNLHKSKIQRHLVVFLTFTGIIINFKTL